jgi:hypothetical protein
MKTERLTAAFDAGAIRRNPTKTPMLPQADDWAFV